MFNKTHGFIALCSCTLLFAGTFVWGKPPVGGERGLGEGQCLPSNAPEIEVVQIGGSQPGAVLVEMLKQRNLAFSVPDAGERAVQVTFDNLPGPFDVANGIAMWVMEPREECENSGQPFGTPIDQCGPTGGLLSLTYTVAQLQCNPLYRDWSADGVFNVYDELIVPNGTYSIRVIEIACSVSDLSSFSEPLTITTPIWGDAVKDCTASDPRRCFPPDGSVDVVTDVTALLGKFSNTMAINEARVAMEPGLLEGHTSIADVTFTLNAFSGDQYPFPAPALPCGNVTSSGSD